MKLTAINLTFAILICDFGRLISALNVTSKIWDLNKKDSKKSIDAAITEYFERKTRLMSVAINLEYSHSWQMYIIDYLTDALKRTESMNFEIFMNNSNSKGNRKQRVFYYNLWYVDSYKAFRSLLPDTENHYNANMGKYVVVMRKTNNNLYAQREVQLILKKSFEFNIVNIVVAVYDRSSIFKLYSYEIFEPQKCRQAIAKQVNIFENGKFQNPELFSYKLANFHNCPISVYIRNASLFFKFNLTKDGTAIDAFKGVEANMIRLMGQKLNFNMSLYFTPDNATAQIYGNGTVKGAFKLLNDQKVDLIMGYYNYPLRSRYYGESRSYVLMPLVVVICEHKQFNLQGNWLIEPFQGVTWTIMGFSVVLTMLLVSFAHYNSHQLWKYSKKVIWLDVVGLVLGNARPLNIHYYTMKFSFSMCIFGSMILCALFQGRLYNAFNRQYDSRPTTVQQLIDSNYTFLLKQSLDWNLIDSLQIPLTQVQFLDILDDYAMFDRMRSHSHNVATITSYWDFRFYVESHQYYEVFDIVPLVVIVHQICAYFRKHSFLIEPINRLLQALDSSGILKKWLVESTNADKINDIELMTNYNLNSEPKPLRFIQLCVVFVGLAVLYGISLLVFLCEIFVMLIKKKLNSQEIKK